MIYDLDETLCTKKQPHETYADVKPIQPMIDQLNEYYDQGHTIIISTARNMLTQNNHVSKCVANVGLDTLNWLQKHNVRYHGLDWGKEFGALYIDDKACINDPAEVERRVNAILNNNEKEYLKQYKNLRKENEELKKIIQELRAEIQYGLKVKKDE